MSFLNIDIGNILTGRLLELLNKAKTSEGDINLSQLSTSERWEAIHYVEEQMSVKDALIVLVLLKIAQTPKGLDVIKEWGSHFLKGLFSTLHALGQASAANQIAAWANPYLVAMILRRFGFISNVHMIRYELGISLLAGASIAEGFADTIQGFFPFSSAEKSEFPSTVVFSPSSGEGTPVSKEKGETLSK